MRRNSILTRFCYSFDSCVSSNCRSSIGFMGGVVAIVHPIHAPMPRMARNPMSTGAAMSQIRMASKAGQNSAAMYAIAMTMQTVQISPPIV